MPPINYYNSIASKWTRLIDKRLNRTFLLEDWMLYASSLRPNVSKSYFGCLIDSCLSVRTIVSRMDKGGHAKVKWKAEWTKLKKLLWRE